MSEQKTAVANATRQVKVVTTRGERKIIETSATTWKELRKDLSNAGYSLENMKAAEGATRHTLEHDAAVLPVGDFKLFLMPMKTKAGAAKKAAPKKAAKKAVKKAVKKATKAAPKKAASRTPKAKEAKNVADVVESVKQKKATDFGTDEQLDKELGEMLNGFSDVKR